MEVTQIDNTIIRLCRQFPAGLTQDVIQKELESVPMAHIADSINRLLSQRRISPLKDANNQIVYREVNTETAKQFKGLTAEDRLVFQVIEQASNKGIWTRDIKSQTSLQQAQITKILKTLESRKLIKSVTSVTSKNKKTVHALRFRTTHRY